MQAPIVFYSMVKDQREDEENLEPIRRPARLVIFPSEGETVRFKGELYYVKTVLWDLEVDEDGDATVSIGLQTLEEMIEDAVNESIRGEA